jgi:hypothetical protein
VVEAILQEVMVAAAAAVTAQPLQHMGLLAQRTPVAAAAAAATIPAINSRLLAVALAS